MKTKLTNSTDEHILTSSFCIDYEVCTQCNSCIDNDPNDLVENGADEFPVWTKSKEDMVTGIPQEIFQCMRSLLKTVQRRQ